MNTSDRAQHLTYAHRYGLVAAAPASYKEGKAAGAAFP